MKKFFTSLSAALVFTALLGLASCSKDNGKTLYIYNWTYYTPEDVVAQFEKDIIFNHYFLGEYNENNPSK